MSTWLVLPVLLAAAVVLLAVARRPEIAGPLYLGSMPFLAGIDRGRLLPLVRPSEVAQAALTGAAWTGLVVYRLRRRAAQSDAERFASRFQLRLTRLDVVLLALAVCGSLLPLTRLSLLAIWPGGDQPMPPTTEDLLACIPLWKLFALYLLFRSTVRTERDALRVMVVTLGAAAVVAVISVLQTLDLFGIRGFLSVLWAPYGDVDDLSNGRGTTTFAGAIATAGYLTFNLGLAAAGSFRGHLPPQRVLPLMLLLAFGLLGTGQISGLIGLLLVCALVAAETGRLRPLAWAATAGLPLTAIPLAPVIEARRSALTSSGLPESWLVRWYNLRTYYWPQLADYHWVLGARPNTILEAPERWRSLIFVESGHTWLLLVGGLPLLGAFAAFVVVAFRTLRSAARVAPPVFGTFAIAAAAAVVATAFLTIFDTHLTMRGSSDMTFALIGVAVAPFGGRLLPWPVKR